MNSLLRGCMDDLCTRVITPSIFWKFPEYGGCFPEIDLKELYYIEMTERKGRSSKKPETEKYDLKALYDIEMGLISNPKTGRSIKIGGDVYNNLIREGYIHNRQRNVLLMRQTRCARPLKIVSIMDSDITNISVEPLKPTHGGALGNVSIMDSDVPDIGVEPLKPTPYQTFKKEIVKKSARMAYWLWKLIQDKRKNIKDIMYWILNQKDKIITKKIPENAKEIMENRIYKKVFGDEKIYWKINEPRDEDSARQKVEANRLKYGKEFNSKYLRMHYYNNIKSLDDIVKSFMTTYKKENKAFKLLFSFGYVTEKHEETEYKLKLYQPSQQYFYDKLVCIKNKKDINSLTSNINAEHVVHKLTEKFPDSATRLIGVFSVAVKVIRLDYPIGSKIKLPDYIRNSRFIVGLDKVGNNLCFWGCMALAEGNERGDSCIRKAKELFGQFYTNKTVTDYAGFDFVNELDKYEIFNTKYAINIVSYYEDESLEYIRRPEFNTNRIPIYLNLYIDHFSYIPDLEKLAKMYICNRCSAKFRDNFILERHVDTCKLEQEDTFVKYSKTYEKKTNDIVELCDWFDVDCDYKYDYLITFDLESMLQRIDEPKGEKLKFVTKHIPVSASIATNVPGFEKEYFILSTKPEDIANLIFKLF